MADKNSYSVLLVDDEPGIVKVLRMFLELAGYRVFEAANTVDTFQIIERDKPDLIILDAALNGESGFDICKNIKSSLATKGIIVFMFTGLNQASAQREGERAGCDKYLTKPQNPKDIVQLVNEYLKVEVGF
jgi:DNA-binding response OmpR family regulator